MLVLRTPNPKLRTHWVKRLGRQPSDMDFDLANKHKKEAEDTAGRVYRVEGLGYTGCRNS